MGAMSKSSELFALVLMILAISQYTRGVEPKPTTIQLPQRYAKVFATLGIACQCCDGVGGECRSEWNESCSKLQCLPRKLY